MQTLLLLIVGLLCHYQCSAQGDEELTFGFVELNGSWGSCTIEGGEYDICVIADSGETSVDIHFDIIRTYDIGSAVIVEPFYITAPFAAGDVQCMEATATNNNFLDRGNIIFLTINTTVFDNTSIEVSRPFTTVDVYDDEVIQFEFTRPFVNATDEATVCVTISCVEEPTRRAVPLLFYVREESFAGVLTDVEPLKKIVLIPKGTVNGDRVCCDFSVGESITQDAGFVVHVSEEDPNVLGPFTPYISVIVQTPNDCFPAFVGDSPSVQGNEVTVTLSAACQQLNTTCILSGRSQDTNDCSQPLVGRGSGRLTLEVRIYFSDLIHVSITRELRLDNANCDNHLINDGIVWNGDGTGTISFVGTGPSADVDVLDFNCRLIDSAGNIISVEKCQPPYTFTIGDAVAIQVQACSDDVGCRRLIRQTYPLPAYTQPPPPSVPAVLASL